MLDPKLHNSECFWCSSTFLNRQFTDDEHNNIGRVGQFGPRACGVCTKAKVAMRDDRANRYQYWSWREINATWHDVKSDQIEEAALRHFAESLPVERETQEALIARLRSKQR
tara:strand:+ start:787 stop:1122 length:336 start_codon:yes stop_codon:yes gene_type:complete